MVLKQPLVCPVPLGHRRPAPPWDACSRCACSIVWPRQGCGAAGVPGMASSTAMPHPPAQTSTRGTLSVLVRGAKPQTWQLRPSLRVSGLGTLAWQGEYHQPHRGLRRLGAVLLLLNLVLWPLAGALGHHGHFVASASTARL